jgi:uncharacterized repeat protein (TIGR01451 family)
MFILKLKLESFFRKQKTFSYLLVFAFLLTSLLPLGLFEKDVEAKFTQDNNNGYYDLDFRDNETGLEPPEHGKRSNVSIDTQSGVANLTLTDQDGYFTTSTITPSSFANWKDIEIEGIYNHPNDVLVSLLDCSGNLDPISDFQNIPLNQNKIDISSLDKNTYGCIKVRLDLSSQNTVKPVINNLRVNWNPLPVFLIKHSTDSEVQAGQKIVYQVNFSTSFADAAGTVIWVKLPNIDDGTIKDFDPSYGQDLTPTFTSATDGGQFTVNEITVNGITIPAGSVFWDLGTTKAGETKRLSYALQTKPGWENGVILESQAIINSLEATEKISDADRNQNGNQRIVTKVLSEPEPTINKTVAGTVRLDNGEHVFDEPSNGYTPEVVYSISVGNSFAAIGREEIFNPSVTDDLSDIKAKLINQCGVSESDWSSRITPNNDGQLDVDGEVINWDMNNLRAGGSTSVSFGVDYTNCPYNVDLEIDNIAHLDADNINRISDSQLVKFKNDFPPTGIFAKGDEVTGSKRISALVDDNPATPQTYEEVFSYWLRGKNSGVVRLDDLVFVDKVPDNLEFISASLPSNADGTIFYTTSGAENDPTNPPSFDWTQAPGALGSGWQNLNDNPPTNPSDVEWVAFYIPCLNSTAFPSPEGSSCHQKPTQVDAEIKVKIVTPADACTDYTIPNTGLFYSFRAGDSIFNTDESLVEVVEPLRLVDDKERTHVVAPVADLSQQTKMGGPDFLDVFETGEYTLTVRNTGFDIARNVVTTIEIPEIEVNGVPTKLGFAGAEGGVVDLSNLPNSIFIDLDDLPAGQSKQVKVRFTVPRGALGSFVVNSSATAIDDEDCKEIRTVANTSTTVTGDPNLEMFKTRDEAIINSGETVNYQLRYFNNGEIPTEQTFVLDNVPDKSVFVEAYTSATDANLNDYTCEGCQVYFSKGDNLPSELNATDPFDRAVIASHFTVGTEISPGVWTSPFGEETKFIAFLVDDRDTGVFGAGFSGMVGFQVKNDNDGIGGETKGSPAGTIIYNYAAIFSDELLQAIGNTVFTTILPNPGLDIEKTSSDNTLFAGQEFDWYIDYYNNSSNANTTTTVSDTLPPEVELLSVGHEWNENTLNNDSDLVSGDVDITGDPNLTITNQSDGTTLVELNVAPGLRGEGLNFLEGGRLTFKVQIKESQTTGDIILNTVIGNYANENSSGTVSDEDLVEVANPDLWLRKVVDRTDPISGELLNYTLLISNEGENEAPDVSIVDTLPAGLCYEGPTTVLTSDWSLPEPQVNGNCGENQTLTWNGVIDGEDSPQGTIPAKSGDILVSYKVRVNQEVPAGASLINGASTTTTRTEDENFPNDDTEKVKIPLPDTYVFKQAPNSIIPGQLFRYTLSYGNTTRQPAANSYLIDTLPDYDGDGTGDLKVTGVTGNNSEVFYFHEQPLNDPAPDFDINNPLDNGWVDTLPANPTYKLLVL